MGRGAGPRNGISRKAREGTARSHSLDLTQDVGRECQALPEGALSVSKTAFTPGEGAARFIRQRGKELPGGFLAATGAVVSLTESIWWL